MPREVYGSEIDRARALAAFARYQLPAALHVIRKKPETLELCIERVAHEGVVQAEQYLKKHDTRRAK